MRTTLTINEELLEKAKTLSGSKTKKEAIEIALEEIVRREKSKKFIELEGKVEFFSITRVSEKKKRRYFSSLVQYGYGIISPNQTFGKNGDYERILLCLSNT